MGLGGSAGVILNFLIFFWFPIAKKIILDIEICFIYKDKAQTMVTKPCHCHHCVCRSKIWHMRRQKFACLQVVLSSVISSFLGFSIVKIHFFQKELKKLSSFQKKITLFLSTSRGGGRGIFHFF